ncbi:hypothetical protein BC629DRAFT_1687961 [Irpex lacteus]|nr:hypothetical protein BC629DRAFT_1687961 [Irpex lacteus]
MTPIAQTYGAILIGGLLALCISGIVCVQCFIYWRTSPNDRLRIKILVLVVWAFDALHSALICSSLWHYFIEGYHSTVTIKGIHWTVCVTVCITGITTFSIQCFFGHRVWTLSGRKKWIPGAIAGLAFLRLLAACGVTAQMSRLHTWEKFHQVAAWSLHTGLVLSACGDVLITASLIYYLNRNRTGFPSSDFIIDNIMLYSVQTGVITSYVFSHFFPKALLSLHDTLTVLYHRITVVVTFICWVAMPQNLIFLALYFVIAKMYANSLLATLNARKSLKDRSGDGSDPWRDNTIRLPPLFGGRVLHRGHHSALGPETALQISVERSVHCVTDIGSKTVAFDIDGTEASKEPIMFTDGKGDVADRLCIGSISTEKVVHMQDGASDKCV